MSSIQSHHERGLSSGAAPVVVRLDVVSFPPRSSAPTVAGCLLGGYPVGRDHWVESALREEYPRTTIGVSQRWFSGHFRHVFFNTIPLPRNNIGADVWGESSIMTGVYQRWCSSTLHIGWGLCDRVCLVLVCRGRYGLGGGGLLFILGLNLGGVGPVRGLRAGRKKGVV
jgi:hypothetical protein